MQNVFTCETDWKKKKMATSAMKERPINSLKYPAAEANVFLKQT